MEERLRMSSTEHTYHQIAPLHPQPHHYHRYHHHHHHHHHHHWEDMTVFLRWLLVALSLVPVSMASRLPLVMLAHHHHHHHHQHPLDLELDLLDPERWYSEIPAPPAEAPQHDRRVRVLYQVGSSEAELPECAEGAVCSKLDVYEKPWLERQCRCPRDQPCPAHLSPSDGHTIVDKTRQLKMCEPVKRLPKCRYFRDVTWTLTTAPGNGSAASSTTQQVVHCHCPRGSVAYLVKRQAFTEEEVPRYKYSFACSPQSRLRCQRKEPCRLFTVRRREELVDDVNTNSLCQCPHSHYCPTHHSDPGVIQGNAYLDDSVRTYSGYCLPI